MKMKTGFAVLKLSLPISLFLISAIWISHGAIASVCGCHDSGNWKCYSSQRYCFNNCTTNYIVYPDMKSCMKKSATPEKSAKKKTKQKPATQPQ